MTCAARLNASLWTRIAPSTDRSASRLCGSVRSAARTAVSAIGDEATGKTSSLQRCERFFHIVVVGLVSRILEHFTMTHDAVLIDDEDRALGDVLHADHVGVEDAVLGDHFLVEVAEQREIELLLIAP